MRNKVEADLLVAKGIDLGGTRLSVTGTELNTLSGLTASTAELNLLDGVTASTAELNIVDGVTKTAAQINLLAAGVAANYTIARGVTAIAAASTDIVTGLATVVAVVASMVGNPSLTHMSVSATVGDQAAAPAAGSIRVLAWKPTGAADVTPIAATSPFGNVAWICIGT